MLPAYIHIPSRKSEEGVKEIKDPWGTNQPDFIGPDETLYSFLRKLQPSSSNFSPAWQAEEMQIPEGILLDIEKYFKGYQASHPRTTVVSDPSGLARHNSIPVIPNDGGDSGIEDEHTALSPSQEEFVTELSDKDFNLYKHSLLCAQYPALSRQLGSSLSTPVPSFSEHPSQSSFLKPNSTSSLYEALKPSSLNAVSVASTDDEENLVQEETLCLLVREVFRLSEEAHMSHSREIYEGMHRRPPTQVLVEELLGRLYLVEKNNHPLYKPEAFLNCKVPHAYEVWCSKERMQVSSHISQFWVGPLPPHDRALCKPAYWESMQMMYQDLLRKLLIHDQRSSGASYQRVILHSGSRRLLKEFALRYGISEVFQSAVFLMYLTEYENFVLDHVTLKVLHQQVVKLNDCFSATEELNVVTDDEFVLACQALKQFQERCQEGLQSLFQKKLSSSIVASLCHALHDVTQLIALISDGNPPPYNELLSAFIMVSLEDWYYHHRLKLTTELNLNAYTTPVTPDLVSKLLDSIQEKVASCRGSYQRLFEEYSVDIIKVASNLLYSKLMTDVKKLYNEVQRNITTASTQKSSKTTEEMISLARELDSLSRKWSSAINRSQETWRFQFIDLAHHWLKQLINDLHQLMKKSVEKDKFCGVTLRNSLDASWSQQAGTTSRLQPLGNIRQSCPSAFRRIPNRDQDVDSLLASSQTTKMSQQTPIEDSSIASKEHVTLNNNVLVDEGNISNNATQEIARNLNQRDAYHSFENGVKPKYSSSQKSVSNESTITGSISSSAHVIGSFDTGLGTSEYVRSQNSFVSSTQTNETFLKVNETDIKDQKETTTTPFSTSVFDFLTMMKCTCQFLNEIRQVLCPSRELLVERSDPSFDETSHHLSSENLFCGEESGDNLRERIAKTIMEVLIRSPDEVVNVLMNAYAALMLSIDLCGTPKSVAEKMIPSVVLDLLDSMRERDCLTPCRHQRAGLNDCNTYIRNQWDLICDMFEPLRPEMCVRINNVEVLLQSRDEILSNISQIDPNSILEEPVSPENESTIELADIHKSLVQLLAYKLNVALTNAVSILLSLECSGNATRDLEPLLKCITKHTEALHCWLYPKSYKLFLSSLWSLIIENVAKIVKSFPDFGANSERLAIHLLQFISALLEMFTQGPNGVLTVDVCMENARSLLYVLQIYALSTTHLIQKYRTILDENWNHGPFSVGDDSIISKDLLSHLTLSLHSKRKCFSENQLRETLSQYSNNVGVPDRDSWVTHVMDELKRRCLLHKIYPVESCTSSRSSTPQKKLYSDNDTSDEFDFPKPTLHRYSQSHPDESSTPSVEVETTSETNPKLNSPGDVRGKGLKGSIDQNGEDSYLQTPQNTLAEVQKGLVEAALLSGEIVAPKGEEKCQTELDHGGVTELTDTSMVTPHDQSSQDQDKLKGAEKYSSLLEDSIDNESEGRAFPGNIEECTESDSQSLPVERVPYSSDTTEDETEEIMVGSTTTVLGESTEASFEEGERSSEERTDPQGAQEEKGEDDEQEERGEEHGHRQRNDIATDTREDQGQTNQGDKDTQDGEDERQDGNSGISPIDCLEQGGDKEQLPTDRRVNFQSNAESKNTDHATSALYRAPHTAIEVNVVIAPNCYGTASVSTKEMQSRESIDHNHKHVNENIESPDLGLGEQSKWNTYVLLSNSPMQRTCGAPDSETGTLYRLEIPVAGVFEDSVDLGFESNTDFLLNVLRSRQKHDKRAKEFMRSVGRDPSPFFNALFFCWT